MAHLPIRSYTSSPYQMVEPAVSAETLYGSQQGSATSEARHHSFEEQASVHAFRQSFTHSPPPAALRNNFDSWMLDGLSCASPLSTCSSLSTSEGIATPPSYADQLPLPVYHLHEPPNQLCQEGPGYSSYRNMDELACDSQFSASSTWNAQTLVPSWSGNSHHGAPLPPTELFVPSMPLIAAPVFSVHGPSQPAARQFAVDSSPFQSKDDESDDHSDSGSEDSGDDYEGSDSSERLNKPRNRTQPQLFMMNKWELSGMSPYERQAPRSYLCPLNGQPDMKGKICTQGFARPEHCRRHVRTVHGIDREYHCKLPKCKKAFSRGDNLRDHYWTHLERGGRIGKNDKMSLAELKEILGKSEKALIRKLKLKMAKHKVKQARSPVLVRSKL